MTREAGIWDEMRGSNNWAHSFEVVPVRFVGRNLDILRGRGAMVLAKNVEPRFETSVELNEVLQA